jgi:hypothetical protein
VPEICAGQIVLFYLFDVSETVDLAAVRGLIGGPTVAAKLLPKQATPAYVQYEKPPLSFDGEIVGIGEIEGFRPRFRLYDYGVISIALVRPFRGEWWDLVSLGQTLIESDEFERRSERLCATIVERLRPALIGYRESHLSEDYVVYAVHELSRPQTAEEVVAERGGDIAAMLRGERKPLSGAEQEAILSHRLSYLADDLVVPTWNAALVYDTPAGAQAALEIVEFANSQLLEFRYYDQLLDRELGAIYSLLQRPRWYDEWIGSRYARAARKVQALFIDVTEVTDRAENALKFTGDIYAARLFSRVADRLGLNTWKADVQGKLKTLDDIYRFAVEQSSMARGQLLELAIVLILVFELMLFFMGVMQ